MGLSILLNVIALGIKNMTVPIERTNAVIWTEEFLYDLIDPKKTPRVPKAIREQARRMLRHYPSKFDMDVIAQREDGKTCCLHKVFGKGYI
jgi:hypothetical protein